MKTLVLAAAAAAALAGATAAHAASGTLNTQFDGTSGSYSDSGVQGSFNDSYFFTNTPSGGLYDISLTSVTPGLDITSASFDGHAITYDNVLGFGRLNGVMVSEGTQTLDVVGTYNGKSGSYSGTVQFTAVSAAPEPATWSLMIAGVALVGGALRLGRRNGWSATAA
jgi:hypothetical protein